MQLGQVIDLLITDLSDNGAGVGRAGEEVVFVPHAVPGDLLQVKIDRVKPRFAQGKILQVLTPSPGRVRPHCIVADKCGGCQWQCVSYDYQLAAKENQVIQALVRLGKFPEAFVREIMHPIVAAPVPYHYRNKVTYPLGVDHQGQVKAGYYQQGSHRLINLNQCPVQDERLNPLLSALKQDIARSGWAIYHENTHTGNLRHLGFRIGRRTGEILVTLVSKEWELPGIASVSTAWIERFPAIVGVVVNRNPIRTNAIFGSESRCVVGRPYVEEIFANLSLHLGFDTFFQVYTEQAEQLVDVLLALLDLKGQEVVLDAYAGVGTLTLPLAQRCRQIYGIEIQAQAVKQAEENATRNALKVQFMIGKVEEVLPTLPIVPDVVVLDPPRKGCEQSVVEHLRNFPVDRLVYISCNPATLARDLQLLCADDRYLLSAIYEIDFFPQTVHVETLVLLKRPKSSSYSP